MSAVMFNRWLRNEDVTSVTYRKYNQLPQDKYPTYSICFEGTKFVWMHDNQIFDTYGLTQKHLELMVLGEKAYGNAYNNTSHLYDQIPVLFDDAPEKLFHRFYLQPKDILLEAGFKIEPSNIDGEQKNTKLTEQPPFYIGYQTPKMVCLTRKSTETLGQFRNYDILSFDRSILRNPMYTNTTVKILVHYPGQLLRFFDSPTFHSTFSEYKWEKTLELKTFDGVLLRKRPESNERCNEKIDDYDAYLLLQVIKRIRCIPPYWVYRLKEEALEFPICKSPSQLKQAYGYILNYKGIIDSHGKPCFQMFSSTLYNWKKTRQGDNGKLQMKVLYKDQYYEDVAYSKSFGFESLISNIGGFVGIFLGISLMQSPELIGKLLNFVKNITNRFLKSKMNINLVKIKLINKIKIHNLVLMLPILIYSLLY